MFSMEINKKMSNDLSKAFKFVYESSDLHSLGMAVDKFFRFQKGKVCKWLL